MQNSSQTLFLFFFSENAIANVDQQSMMSVIEDKQSHHLRLLLRLSVNEGVCHMYKQYSSRKWTEVC